jgi:hypothetical protein
MSPDDARGLSPVEQAVYLKLIPRVAAAEARWLNIIDKGEPKDVDMYLSYLAGGGDPAEFGRVKEEGLRAIAQFQEMLEKGARKQ